MFKEKVLVTFLAILGGIVFSIGLFFIYQKTQQLSTKPPSNKETVEITPTPVKFFLNIDNPQNEAVFDKKIIQLSGKTLGTAVVVIMGQDKEFVLMPAADGSFSTTITLLDGVNQVEVIAINADGKIITDKLTATYTKEDF